MYLNSYKHKLIPSVVADWTIEIMKKIGKFSLNDDNKLIYFEENIIKDEKLTKLKIESIVEIIINNLELNVEELFYQDVYTSMKRKLYIEIGEFEKTKENISNFINDNIKKIERFL